MRLWFTRHRGVISAFIFDAIQAYPESHGLAINRRRLSDIFSVLEQTAPAKARLGEYGVIQFICTRLVDNT
jgi:hypothetical protein